MNRIIAEKRDEEGFWLILCPKEEKEIPIYHCAGSFVKGKPVCEHVRMASMGIEKAYVKCLYPKKRKRD